MRSVIVVVGFLLTLALWAAETPDARLATLDAYALAAPPAAEASVKTLAAYLTAPTRSDTEKARLLFRWIADRISYFPPALRPRQEPPRKPEDVLRERRAVCDGYARLYDALARAAGLESSLIFGYARGYGYAVGASPKEPDHAWNAVRVDGAWRLLDATWGAGSLTDDGQFVRAFNPHYFLTPPEQFIYDHFPEDPRWQLLDAPVSRETFNQFVLVRPTFFLHGLRLDSHPTARIQARESLRVTLSATQPVELMAVLRRGTTELNHTLTFAQREGDRYAVYAVFPETGDYTLRLFVRAAGETGAFTWMLDYAVQAAAGAGAGAGFPQVFGRFSEAGARLAWPLAKQLPAGRAVTFDLTVPGAVQVGVRCGETWSWLTRAGDRFTGTAAIRAGDVLVAGKFPGADGYAVLIGYDGVIMQAP